MKFFLLLLNVIFFQFTSLTAQIVVTSKPLYFVVAPLMKGIDTPKLLINPGHCGHHYHLRPSEVQSLKKAELIFWSGKVHEPFMGELIENLKTTLKVFDETEGFAWLSPSIVIKKLPIVVEALKKIYSPKFHARIEANAMAFHNSLKELHSKIKQHMMLVKDKSFLTTYPFLTYFAQEYQMDIKGYMLGTPEEAITPQRLKNIYKLLQNDNIKGIIKDQHMPFSVVQTLVKAHSIPIITIDPEGVNIAANLDGYHILIERLVQSIVK